MSRCARCGLAGSISRISETLPSTSRVASRLLGRWWTKARVIRLSAVRYSATMSGVWMCLFSSRVKAAYWPSGVRIAAEFNGGEQEAASVAGVEIDGIEQVPCCV